MNIIRVSRDYRKNLRPWAWWIESTDNRTITHGGDEWTEESAQGAAERFLAQVYHAP